ncbi:hypothetical protein CHS0354_031892 [Potamilus streckersoni]|uniref:Opioid growth factor receptor (OGFr) conserved domain-containing protein n=1 Tax=Potamilus streckersoni TaxID=2493646 RepID=A0AAE0VLS2_9BIVA|nr:hypothetical protein CHS0354_031892 [Potamilus streckersoni]
MSKSSRDVGKTKNLKQATMGNIFPFSGASSKKKYKKRKGKMTFWGRSSAKDTEEYREEYPGKKDNVELDANVRFYKNEIQSKPDGALIEDILEKWWGDYKLLERHHGYIQWLFPIREDGMNWHAQELQKHEIGKICDDKEAHARVLRAYKMMLDFYGMKLGDDESGKIERAENWEERFKHLNRSFHNYLRITRILKCLGELRYEHLKKPFIKFILQEAIVEETLPNLLSSCCSFWMDVLRLESDREEVWQLYENLSDDENDRAKKLKTSDDSDVSENEMVENQEEPTQENSNEELTQMYKLDASMESENESSKKIEKNDKSENDLKFSNLKSSENRNVKEEEESTQVDNIEKSAKLNDPENEKDESNKKLTMRDNSENDLTSLKVCTNGNIKGQEESAQGDNMKKLAQEFDSDVLVAENESKNFEMKDELKNNITYANLKTSANEKIEEEEESKQEVNNDKPTQVDDQDVLGQAENEKKESSNILKVKDESENDDKPENLTASEIGKENEQGESEQGNTTVESTHIFGPVDIMKETKNEKNENHKKLKMKDESENDLKSANEDIKEREESAQEDNIEKSTPEVDPDVMMKENEKNENSNKLTMKENYLKSLNSENEDVKEQESKQRENIEELAEMNDTDILREAENNTIENNNTLKVKDESENNGKSANLMFWANKEHEKSEQGNNVEELTRDVLMEVEIEKNKSINELIIKKKSENAVKCVDMKASANEEVQEHEESTEEDNIEKSTHLDDSDQSRKTCGHEVTERHHEHVDSQMEDGQKDSDTQVSSESESVEMTDDSERQLYSGQTN